MGHNYLPYCFLGFFVLTLAGSLRVCAKMCKKSRKNVFSRKKKKVRSTFSVIALKYYKLLCIFAAQLSRCSYC